MSSPKSNFRNWNLEKSPMTKEFIASDLSLTDMSILKPKGSLTEESLMLRSVGVTAACQNKMETTINADSSVNGKPTAEESTKKPYEEYTTVCWISKLTKSKRR
jgi:hypothetical protein